MSPLGRRPALATRNLTTRVLVALVGIPAILLVTMAGGYIFFLFVAVVATIGLLEFYALAGAKGAWPMKWPGILLGLLLLSAFMYHRFRDALLVWLQEMGQSVPVPTMSQFLLIVLLIAVPLLLAMEMFRNRGSPFLNLATTLFGVLYVSFFFGTLVGIRELFIPEDFPVHLHFPVVGVDLPPEVVGTIDRWGGYTVIVIFAAIWSCDSAAYFAGTWLGRHKLFERVSPKKTWEGAVAGFLFAVAAFVAGKALVLPYLTFPQALICGTIVGLLGQVGDLAESLLKRDAGVKDSSTLIPGHGGVLDRFDSIMFVAPILYFYLDFVVF